MRVDETRIDALTELVNIGAGRAAASLSEMLGDHIDLSIPYVAIGRLSDVECRFTDTPLEVAVVLDFKGGLSGRALLVFPHESGVTLGQFLLGGTTEETDFSGDLACVLEEVGNIMLNSVVGSLGNVAQSELLYSVPQVFVGQRLEWITSAMPSESPRCDSLFSLADARFNIATRSINGSLVLVFDEEPLKDALNSLLSHTTKHRSASTSKPITLFSN